MLGVREEERKQILRACVRIVMVAILTIHACAARRLAEGWDGMGGWY